MIPLDRTVLMCRMLQVTETIDDGTRLPAQAPDALVDAIVAEYEPIVARTRRAMAGFWHDRKVSKTTLFVLLQLDAHGPLSMSRLAGLLDAGLSNVTGIVTRMEDLGYVERVRDERDRRVVLVRVTERGHEVTEELHELRRRHVRDLVLALDPSDRQACLQAFRALRQAAERLDPGAVPDQPSC